MTDLSTSPTGTTVSVPRAAGQLLSSPALLTVLLMLVIGTGVGVAAGGGHPDTAATPASQPATTAPAGEVASPAPSDAAPDSVDIPARGVPAEPLLNHGRATGYQANQASHAAPATSPARSAGKLRGLGPLHIGDLATAVILVVAVALLVSVGRMMLRLFAVLGAVVEVTAKIGTSLTLLMAILGLVIVAVVVAH